jgi:phosphatidylserine/phosphatidylglycerophosphate/cardiolipin synthase-like enzyme
MKKYISIAVILFVVFLIALQPGYATDLTLNNTPTQVCFSPNGGCTVAIISQIDKAKSEILVQAYSFTSASISLHRKSPIKRPQTRYKGRNDTRQESARRERYTSATFMANSGIPTFIDDKHAIAHNKIMIIDKETVITGSFNFTKAAEEKNAENLLIMRNKDLAKVYIENWYKHKEHSEPYER